ncbi:MAG TPA: hypothetical protein DHV48_07775 [Prolixibacteraceae bacterium]|nr:hypothetical protein [Prolixibacteraceae bacterium]
MIVRIDIETFFSHDDVTLNALTKIIEGAISNRFLLFPEDIYEFLDKIEESYWFTDFLSSQKQKEFFETLKIIIHKTGYITQMHTCYLTSITIGLKDNMINPIDASVFLMERSKVIVENSTNDWKFIKGIAEKYRNHKKRKSIYSILFDAIENDLIEPEHAGGKGEINKRIRGLIVRFGENYKLKLGTVFDSDRNSKDDKCSDVQRLLIEELTHAKIVEPFVSFTYKNGDLVVWHMLYKREIENYLPIQVLGKEIKMEGDFYERFAKKTIEELDYCKFADEFKGIDTKNEFPELFLKTYWRKDELERRCDHHRCKIELPNGTLEEVSEIEVLLLNISKIV